MLKAWEAENTTGHTQRVRIIISQKSEYTTNAIKKEKKSCEV